MEVDFANWLNLALRWLHVITGIAWIGSSFYFIWLDGHLRKPQGDSSKASGELWSVHGGGFYHNQKYQVAPEEMPEELHWFKWEAYFTWMSGFALLVLVYYYGAESFLVDKSKSDLKYGHAISIGLASLVLGWIFYDLICKSPLGKDNRLVGIFWSIFLIAAAYILDQYFNSRAAYIHVGAIMGTAMAANVFFIIIPNQRKVVADLVANKTPDPKLGAQAKQRSLHNNYMTLPVLFVMISHHYPMTYGADRPWLVLALLAFTGMTVRHIFNLRHKGQFSPVIVALAVMLAFATVSYVSIERSSDSSDVQTKDGAKIGYSDVAPILEKHCTSCHQSKPTHPGFSQPPAGMVLDDFDKVKAVAAQIKAQTVDSKIMPLGNETKMTEEERKLLGQWIAKGAAQ